MILASLALPARHSSDIDFLYTFFEYNILLPHLKSLVYYGVPRIEKKKKCLLNILRADNALLYKWMFMYLKEEEKIKIQGILRKWRCFLTCRRSASFLLSLYLSRIIFWVLYEVIILQKAYIMKEEKIRESG